VSKGRKNESGIQDIGLKGDLIYKNSKTEKMPADSVLKASKSPIKSNDIESIVVNG